MSRDNHGTCRHDASLTTPGGTAGLRMLTMILAILLVLSGASAAEAGDYCRLFVNADFKGLQRTYELPDPVTSSNGTSWGASSVRHLGRQLDHPRVGLYRQVEAIRIVALESDVVLYLYSGDNFDGDFLAIRCKHGHTCVRRLAGSWRDRTRSFICQRDDFVAEGDLGEVLQNHLVPTFVLAAPITATIHDGVLSQRHRFYSLNLQYGRVMWSNRHDVCRELDCGKEDFQDKYRDYIWYRYKTEGKLRLDGQKYNIYINIWSEPVLRDGRLLIIPRWWKARVSGGAYSRRIVGAIADQIRQRWAELGPKINKKLERQIVRLLGANFGKCILNYNQRLIFSHPCEYLLQRVVEVGHTFSTVEVENFCGGSTPVYAAAPGLRLVKDPYVCFFQIPTQLPRGWGSSSGRSNNQGLFLRSGRRE